VVYDYEKKAVCAQLEHSSEEHCYWVDVGLPIQCEEELSYKKGLYIILLTGIQEISFGLTTER
jgi:hypothetical protein